MPVQPDVGSLGDRLRARRKELDLTLAQVAERADLSLPYVSNLERGRGNPTIDALKDLSTALEIPIALLLDDDVETESTEVVNLLLANLPSTLENFSRTREFKEAIEDFARRQNEDAQDMRVRILLGMVTSPRRSSGNPTTSDWMRLLDVYRLILSQERSADRDNGEQR
jgi:transcriptional regulator with XRE-family HTH domain